MSQGDASVPTTHHLPLPPLHEALCFLAKGCQRHHQAPEIFLQHFEDHLIIEVIQFTLGCYLHAENERLEQFEDNGCITPKSFVYFSSIREVDDVRDKFNIYTANLAQQGP